MVSVSEEQPARTELALDADFGNLAAIRLAVRDVCEDARFAPVGAPEMNRGIAELELAVTELVSNVIRHGHEGVMGGKLMLSLSASDDGVFRMSVEHNGAAFDGNNAEINEITEPLEGGMGLYLIRECVDQVTYGTSPSGGSRIELTKTFSLPNQETEE